MDNIKIALAGNPNVGKSTVFNHLTGLKQHTGNWPGKTVDCFLGTVICEDEKVKIIDTPGTYSIHTCSAEEEATRDFLLFGDYDCVIVVADAVCLKRNLALLLQLREFTGKIVLCVNLIDEAKRKGVQIDYTKLENLLGIAVVATSARRGIGIDKLLNTAYGVAKSDAKPQAITYPAQIEEEFERVINALPDMNFPKRLTALAMLSGDSDLTHTISLELGVHFDKSLINSKYSETITGTIIEKADEIAEKTISSNTVTRKISRLDDIFMSRRFGIPIMLFLLFSVLWLTIFGANYPSQALENLLCELQKGIGFGLNKIGTPQGLQSLLIDGIFGTLFKVVSVMLPPMMIFFPLFTILEDAGYLPRIAFNMDSVFARAGSCGKQALTMCMGLGCNAVGVTGCRIIDSKRERIVAMLTNTFTPCNGRFPAMIAITALFLGTSGTFGSLYSAATLLCVLAFGTLITLMISKLLSLTLLKSEPSSFTLELPPYRRPDFARVIYRSFIDRTLRVLGRAAIVAAPAGAVIWLLCNIEVRGISLLNHSATFLTPLGDLMGLDGYILLAFILGLPANEIVLPIIVMSYLGSGVLADTGSGALFSLLTSNGWTTRTAICFLLFSLVHFPCGTTLLTIRKETGGIKWAMLGFALPTAVGIILCISASQIMKIFM